MPLSAPIMLLVFALFPAQAWGQASVLVDLREEAVVEQRRLVLSDVAQIHATGQLAQEMAAIPLGRAPRIGYRERLSREQIELAIRRHGSSLASLQWQGAPAVMVSTRAQVVPQQVLIDAATVAVKAQFSDLVIEPGTPPGDIEVPFGRLEVKARAAPVVVHGASAPVWLDLLVGGEIYRSVVVRLGISLRRPVYVARRDIAPGALAGPGDFDVRETDVGTGEVMPANQPLQSFRAARAIRAGQPLTPAAMLARGTIVRGDQVRVSIQSGPISIETAATAMADASPGQALKVRPAGNDNLIAGRVSQSGTVIIE